MHFQHIILILRKFDPNFNASKLNSAITFSIKYSNNNIPQEIAEIITSIYPDSNSVITALWFFTIEHKNLKSIKIEHFFSKEIFDIFYALTKLFKIDNIYSDVTSQKTIRLLSSLDSNIKIKVLLIRFAYLLHKIIFNSNVSHIEYVWISKEMSKIYVPLFKEIEVGKIKVALQNACFKNLHPRLYKTIISFLDREYLHYELVAQIIDAFHNILPATNIEYTISGRIKSPYSIAKKIVHKSSTIQQLYDIIGIRVIVENKQECYDILDAIYKHYAYIPERYKNLIKFPKKNGYQSLHTVIINKDLRKVEVQIRTKIMHYIAEHGTASHSQYKMGLINISNIAYNILNRLILNQLIIIPVLHGKINNGYRVYAQLLTNEVSKNVLVQQLLDINLENKIFVNDNLPLHDAVKSGCEDIVALLLPQSTDVNILGQHNKTHLHYAAASRKSRASIPMNIRTNEISDNPLESSDIEQESNIYANDSGIVDSNYDDEDYTTFNPGQSRASTPVNIRTNEISDNPLESSDIEQESNIYANDSGIVDSNYDDEDYTTFNPGQSRASTPVNIRTNEISDNPLESSDIEQESNIYANDSGIVDSNYDDEDYTTFNPGQSRASTPVNIRTNEISDNPLESSDIEQESNIYANDSGIVDSNYDDEDYTTFNPGQSRASTPVNIRTNEISDNPLESSDIEQESNIYANDSGIVDSNYDDEDYTTFNPGQSRASTPVNIRTNEISDNPLESSDIEQESNIYANDSGIVDSNYDDEDYTTFNPGQSRASTPVNIRTNEISDNPLESSDIEQESNIYANDSGIVDSNYDDEDYTTFNPGQSRASTPVNIRTNEISDNPLESSDIEQESNIYANDSGIVDSNYDDEDYTTFNPGQSRASTPVNIRTNEISDNPLESSDIEQESNIYANDSGIVDSNYDNEDYTTFNPGQSRASTPVNIRTNEISDNPLESSDIEQESNIYANDSGIVDSNYDDEDYTTFNPGQSRASIPMNIRTNEISDNPLESSDIEQESNIYANDSGIVDSNYDDEDYTTFNPGQSRASIPMNIRTNEISDNPLESSDIEQESNIYANDSGIVDSNYDDEDYTTFNPGQSRASIPMNIRTNEISDNPLESSDIEQESNIYANDSGIVDSNYDDEDYTTFNPGQSRASIPMNIRTNEISDNPLESSDIEQESNIYANDSGIVDSNYDDEDYTTFNPGQSRASIPMNIRTNEISDNPLESSDIEQESNIYANDSGIVDSNYDDEDYTTFNPGQSRASIPMNIRTNEISDNPLESSDIEQESNIYANDSGIVDSNYDDEDYTTFNPGQSRASIPMNIRTNEISDNPLESSDIEQESNIYANDSGIVDSNYDDEDYTTFNPGQSRASTPVNIRTNEISTWINSTVDETLINLANLPNLVGTSLDLSNKLLDDKDMEYLFKILLPETCITSLNLSNNILVCGKVSGIRYLIHLLNTQITSLNLSNNRLGQLPQEDIEHFISILPNTQITSLNLSNNQLTCPHLKYFTHTLPKTKIMLLDLSNNSLGREKDMEYFIKILSKTKITSLNLSNNNLDDTDIYNLADILPNSRITNINLSYNDVTPDLDNEILIDALQKSSLITKFDIDNKLLFSEANTIINQNQTNNKKLFSIFNKIVCKDNNNLTLIKKDTIEVAEYFFVIKHLIKTTNVFYLLSTQYHINNTKMWFTEEELINFIQRIPSEFRELMILLDCQVTTQVNVLKQCEENNMNEVVKELLLARELYKTNKEKNILHEYVYRLLSKYELPIIHDGMCNNPSREDLIHHFQSDDYQENQEAQYVVSLLGNNL